MNYSSLARKGIALTLGVSMAIGLTGCTEEDATTMNTDPNAPMKIGAIAPLTGDAAAYGIPLQRVAELAKEKINKDGGISGKNLEIVWEDGGCTKEGAINAANKLVNVDKVKVILGGFCSDETLGAKTITERKNVILFSPGSSSPKVTTAGDFVFRNWPSDASQGKLLGEYAVKKDFKKVGIISEQTDYALGIRNTFVDNFKKDGRQVVTESYTKKTADFRTQLLKLKGEEIDALLINSQTPAKSALIVKQIKELELKMPLLINEVVLGDNETLTNYKDLLEGAISANVDYNSEHPEWKALDEQYKKRHGEDIVYPAYMSTTYDAVFILKEAIEKEGMSSEKIKNFLYAIKDREGVAGTLTMDENGDPTTGHSYRIVKDGKAMPFEG